MPIPEWLAETRRLLTAGIPAVLVTVARAEGSTPREAGARMLVSRERQWHTLGGGHLEWHAADLARQMLRHENGGCGRRIERLSLGPSLGQCCGGVATLAFELLTPSDLDWVVPLAERLQAGRACVRSVILADAGAPPHASPVMLADPPARARAAPGSPYEVCTLWQADGRRGLTEIMVPIDFPVVLFGAGHVGQALVQVLGALPCQVTWVDERDAQFPAAWPANTAIEATDTPEAVIALAPPRSYFLVMTHSHALDQHLCRHIFQRDDFAYFGLIGSRTKRRKFERRLQEQGIAPQRLAQMTCPIGVEGVTGKAPEVVAIAVAAQLLRVREQQDNSATPHWDTRSVAVPFRTPSSMQDEFIG
jgi:xanthine dehydrogenase accessory factor